MFIDTHTHMSYSEGVNPDLFVKNANDVGVNKIIVSCCDMKSLDECLEFASKYSCVYLTIGIHPEYTDSYDDSDLDLIEQIAKKNDKVIGIGEIGLDYHYSSDNKEEQRDLFLKQLEIAKRVKLPVVIHSRDAIQETYDILKSSDCFGVIHCFSGSYEMACKFINLGYYLGIGGVVTFSNSKLYQVIEKIGIDHIVLETDSPYLSPVPYRGTINESKNIPIIASKISEIIGISVDDVSRITTKNANDIYFK